jgi:L-serine dehydratase
MALSAFDLYSVGIGPSSSHTVGPMRAAKRFADGLVASGRVGDVRRVRAELFGSLGATGHGHGSPKAVVLGLEGEDPATVDTDLADGRLDAIRSSGTLRLAGSTQVPFDVDEDLVMHRRRSLPAHPNGMTFAAYDGDDQEISFRTYYSVGGGFVVDEEATGADRVVIDETPLRYPFANGGELLAVCAREGLSISDVMLANEQAWRTEAEIRAGMLHLWSVMRQCVQNGYRRSGVLPGGLRVPRRAPAMYRDLIANGYADPLHVMDWVNLYALSVNEENASGGRIVTAPTNGAAGIIPAVLHYYIHFVRDADDDGIVRYLLTAAAIGILFKTNASISGAEVGCQGEVGSACSMAAGGLAEVLGATPAAGRERRRGRHRAQPGPDLRPGRRSGADPVHRAQRDRVGEGDQRRPAGDQRRREPQGQPGQGDQDHARHRA